MNWQQESPLTSDLQLAAPIKGVLRLMADGLKRLAEEGVPSVIDLEREPLDGCMTKQLLLLLGKGEVSARLDATGESLIEETSIAGVWLVTHHSADGKGGARLLEVTRIPEIMLTPQEDLSSGLLTVEAYLNKE
ncbi:hydrogenase expression/formation C-terminal domain-containing protein [Magnetococcus sp. PR-3]|uniref:hydrogenase expression/formation C-terminal domain-containing protein n=1 Tax=Magnetococcus sp. PR-3 TaxID=3120355 RepID=UPI002FCE382D